ncbi:hypothetical protein LQZ18_02885 [Lachnospiraceae bacterium ZAX-1]
MIDNIHICTKCNLCKNQEPLLDDIDKCQIFWVGLSAKKVTCETEKPLSATTNSGKLICSIEEKCSEISTYKTNLVKCVPLNEKDKLRYPNKKEIDTCFPNLMDEISELLPKIVFLLGEKVTTAVKKQYHFDFDGWSDFDYNYFSHNGTYFVPIHHPSYIHVYKRKQMDEYIEGVVKVIKTLL